MVAVLHNLMLLEDDPADYDIEDDELIQPENPTIYQHSQQIIAYLLESNNCSKFKC